MLFRRSFYFSCFIVWNAFGMNYNDPNLKNSSKVIWKSIVSIYLWDVIRAIKIGYSLGLLLILPLSFSELCRTWKNAELGESMIQTLEKQSLELARDSQRYREQLHLEALALRDEMDKCEVRHAAPPLACNGLCQSLKGMICFMEGSIWLLGGSLGTSLEKKRFRFREEGMRALILFQHNFF